MKVYKLTDQDLKTRNNTTWGPGVCHQTTGEGDLCGPGWLHFYYSPELAVLLNPIHASVNNPILWECRTGRKIRSDRGLKGGTTELTTVKQLPLPEFTMIQRVAFGIYCALEGKTSPEFKRWADNWLSGTDRSEKAARAAAAAAWAADLAAAAWAAAWAAVAQTEALAAAARAADLAAAAQTEALAAAARAADLAAAARAADLAAAQAVEFSFLQKAALKALKIK